MSAILIKTDNQIVESFGFSVVTACRGGWYWEWAELFAFLLNGKVYVHKHTQHLSPYLW